MADSGSAMHQAMDRRSLFKLIGVAAGSAVMYRAMFQLGYAAESSYTGPVKLEGHPQGVSVLILGAGLAGMTAALELRNAGYKVQVLEYNDRPGGRNWSLYGGDTYTELGGFRQHVEFDKGLYINPGPWRLPYHHRALFDYCKRLHVRLEPFIQANKNAYVHSTKAFGGKPQRFRHVQADFQGHVAELLVKCTNQGALDQAVTREDREILLQAMREWGALDQSYRYRKGPMVSEVRGYDLDPGGGLDSIPVLSSPMSMSDLLTSRLWSAIGRGQVYDYEDTMFEPVGGMGMIGRAFGRELGPLIRYNSKVTEIHQDQSGVTVTYEDARARGPAQHARADWCICTIPLSILDQIPMNVGAPMLAAIDAIAYVASVKVGLQFKRRFWEQDDQIYGGISYTDQTIDMIGYPSTGFFDSGKAVLLGAYAYGPHAFELTAMTPQQRIQRAVQEGSRIHPQYPSEYENGVAVAWHRVPWTLGCFAKWSDEQRTRYYDDLCAIDGHIVLAGEHCSRLPAWQEGAVLSALDAIKRLHQRVLSEAA